MTLTFDLESYFGILLGLLCCLKCQTWPKPCRSQLGDPLAGFEGWVLKAKGRQEGVGGKRMDS